MTQIVVIVRRVIKCHISQNNHCLIKTDQIKGSVDYMYQTLEPEQIFDLSWMIDIKILLRTTKFWPVKSVKLTSEPTKQT